MANTHSLDLELSSNQYASIADASQTGLDITGDISVECWVKIESQPGDGTEYTFASKWNGTGNQRSWQFGYSRSGATYYIYTYISGTGSWQGSPATAQTLTNGIWYHVAFTWKALTSEHKLYLNGGLLDTQTSTATALYNSSAAFVVGARGDTGGPHDGLIDDIRIWNDVRTADEIETNFHLELTGTEANLVGYWKFNNDYLDETSNNNDLTASGSPVFSTDYAFESVVATTNYLKYYRRTRFPGSITGI